MPRLSVVAFCRMRTQAVVVTVPAAVMAIVRPEPVMVTLAPRVMFVPPRVRLPEAVRLFVEVVKEPAETIRVLHDRLPDSVVVAPAELIVKS